MTISKKLLLLATLSMAAQNCMTADLPTKYTNQEEEIAYENLKKHAQEKKEIELEELRKCIREAIAEAFAKAPPVFTINGKIYNPHAPKPWYAEDPLQHWTGYIPPLMIVAVGIYLLSDLIPTGPGAPTPPSAAPPF